VTSTVLFLASDAAPSRFILGALLPKDDLQIFLQDDAKTAHLKENVGPP
jgi:hypothetical protein